MKEKLKTEKRSTRFGVSAFQLSVFSSAIVALGLIGLAGFHRFSGVQAGVGERESVERREAARVRPAILDARLAKLDEPTSVAGNIAKITLHCRAVNPVHGSPDADTKIAYALERELKGSALFDAEEIKLGSQIKTDPDTDTFTFEVTVPLKRPIKL